MSTGQTFLTIGALIIFGYLALNVNRINLDMVRFSIEQQRSNDAIHYGQSIADELYATPYGALEPSYGSYTDVENASSRLSFETIIGDMLYATIDIQDQDDILLGIDGKIIHIDVYRHENDEYIRRLRYTISIPEPTP